MIARFLILLPLDLFIAEASEWPALEVNLADYHVRVYAPFLNADRPKATDSVLFKIRAEVGR